LTTICDVSVNVTGADDVLATVTDACVVLTTVSVTTPN